jgi:acyl-CoA synthetase (AMP-forming)/AMP-acid ligase II
MNTFRSCQTLAEPIQLQARENPTDIAMRHSNRTTTFVELDRRSNQVANALCAIGLHPRDRIAYLGKNSDYYFELLFGVTKANMAFVPVNWRLALPELTDILRDAAPRVLFVGRGFEEVGTAVDIPNLRARIFMDDARDVSPTFMAWRDAHPPHALDTDVASDDTALILYTSGTTGLPKGVELTHRNMLAFLSSYTASDVCLFGPGKSTIVCLPPYHVAGTAVGLLALSSGVRTNILEEVSVQQIIGTIEQDRVTSVVLVPAVILMVVQHCETHGADLSSVRRLVYGASPIAEDLLLRAMRVFANASFCQVYGSTESSAVATILGPADHDATNGRLRSCGKAHAGTEVCVVDGDGNAMPTGQVGEVVLRGPCVMKGYWRNQVATEAAFYPNGWLRTGDAAYFDTDGFLFIYDRVKDMIVTGAENVYPAEVENAIFGHPAVADVAVIGVPDPRWGEAVKAIVVPRLGATPKEQDIIAYARERIAGFKLPKSIDFVAELPRTLTGKVLRRELREPYWRGHSRRVG